MFMTIAKNTKKSKTGFVVGVFDILHIGHLSLFKKSKELCEKLIVGVLPRENSIIPPAERVEVLRALLYVDDVIIIEETGNYIQSVWENQKFDIFFTAEDKKNDPEIVKTKEFLLSKGADTVFLPYIEGKSIENMRAKANEVFPIVVFGTGHRFDKYMEFRGEKNKPLAAFDNDPDIWGTEKHGVMIKPPHELPKYMKEGTKVVITNANPEKIIAQLEEMGIKEYYRTFKITF